MIIDPVRERLEAYCHKSSQDEIVTLPIVIENFPKQPEGLKIETFPDIFPMEKPNNTNGGNK